MKWYVRLAGASLCAAMAASALTSCDPVLKEIEKDASEVRLTLGTDGHGTVFASADNPLHVGDLVSITAVPDDGWTFSEWVCVLGTAAITDPSKAGTDLTMSSDCSVQASFVGRTFTLQVGHDGNCSAVTLNGSSPASSTSGVVNWGEYVTLEAVPLPNYTFVRWEVTGSGVQFRNDDRYANPVEVKLTQEDATLTAVAALDTYALVVGPAIPSQGSTNPSGTVNVPYNEWVPVQAIPNDASGYVFDRWETAGPGTIEFASGTGTANQDVRVAGGAATLTADFKLKSYALTVAAGTGGTASPGSAAASHGVPMSISAAASTGYHFTGWAKTAGTGSVTFGNASSASTTATVTNGDVTVQAYFALDTYTLTLSAGTGGSVSPGSATVQYGVASTISATASTGYHFTGWAKTAGTGSVTFGNASLASTTATVTNGSVTIQASFALDTYTLTLSAGTGGSVSPGSATVQYGVASSISATASTGYHFTTWAKTAGTGSVTFGNAGSASTTATVTGGNVTIQASFALDTYTLTLSAGTGGSVSPGSATVQYGVASSISATASTGYHFTTWARTGGTGSVTFGNAALASTTATVTGGNVTIQASFALDTYTLTLAAGTGGTVSPASATVQYGVASNISATPSTGYNFSGWAKTAGTGAVTFGNAGSASTTATVTGGNVTIQASFVLQSFTVTMKRETLVTTGDTTPSQGAHSYSYGTVLTIEALASTDQVFEKWTATGTTLTNAYARKTTCTITGPTTITAYFNTLLAPSSLTVGSMPGNVRILQWTSRSAGTEEGFEVWLSYPGMGDLFIPIANTGHTNYLMWNASTTEPYSGNVARLKVAAYVTDSPGTEVEYSVSPEWMNTMP